MHKASWWKSQKMSHQVTHSYTKAAHQHHLVQQPPVGVGTEWSNCWAFVSSDLNQSHNQILKDFYQVYFQFDSSLNAVLFVTTVTSVEQLEK